MGIKLPLQNMAKQIKNQKEILAKLNIESLNAMQVEAQSAIHSNAETLILSPTGSGKTLSFLLPMIAELRHDIDGVQALILVPSRELAIQIEQVIREMGSGFKANAVYGGRPISKDKLELKHNPSILIATPGRIADHLRRGTVSEENIDILILDEFDKSLEVGFEVDMRDIIYDIPQPRKIILTSATFNVEIPEFVGLKNPKKIDFLKEEIPEINIKVINSPEKDKLVALGELLTQLNNQPGIIFCNFKDSIDRVSEYLEDIGINHACFYGGMEQRDREEALIKFRNASHQLLIATDLAARGIDVPEIKFIIHYHLPTRVHEFIHRNGRTARMHREGTAYILKHKQEYLPEFIQDFKPTETTIDEIKKVDSVDDIPWTTLVVSGGRKDKISKGDIAGLFFKQGKLEKDQLGLIELKQDAAFVAVKTRNVVGLIELINNTKLKKKKVRIKYI